MAEAQAKQQEKKVKIRTRRPCLVDRHLDKNGDLRGTIIPEGREVEVAESEATELCEKQFKGHYSFGGERQFGYNPETPNMVIDPQGKADATKMHDYRRAERV